MKKNIQKLLVLVFCFSMCGTANATLLSVDLNTAGDGLLTLDTNTNIEWLDLTLTQGQSYNSILANFGGYVGQGFRHAIEAELCGLFGALGDQVLGCANNQTNIFSTSILQSSATELVSKLGDTFVGFSSSSVTCGIYDGGLIQGNRVGLAGIEAGSNAGCVTGFPAPPSVATLDNWITTGGTNSLVGHYLVRNAINAPEPTTLALLSLGLFGLNFTKRKRV